MMNKNKGKQVESGKKKGKKNQNTQRKNREPYLEDLTCQGEEEYTEPGKERRKNNLWSPSAEIALIDEMLRIRRLADHTVSFNHTNLANTVNSKTPGDERHTPSQVKGKIHRFRTAWVDHNARMNKTGMGYDPDSGEPYSDQATMERQFGPINAGEDIQEIPSGRMSALEEIFRHTTATGQFGQSSAVPIDLEIDEEPVRSGASKSKTSQKKKGRGRSSDEPDPTILPSPVPRIPPRMPPGMFPDNVPSKKSKSSSDWKTALSSAAASIETFNNYLLQQQMQEQLHVGVAECDPSRYTIERCLLRLEKWRPYLSYKKYVAAAEALKDENNRRIFMVSHRRKVDRMLWLNSQPIPPHVERMHIRPQDDPHDPDAWEEVDDDNF